MRLYFLGLELHYTKNSFQFYIGKCMGTKDVYKHGKKELILKTPLAILNMQMHRRKVLFMKTSKNWSHFPNFFIQDFNLCDFISWDLIDSPHFILGKSPRNLNLRTLFPVTSGNWDFLSKFLFPGIFQKLFPVTFWHRFTQGTPASR